jgi:hypothetical protein
MRNAIIDRVKKQARTLQALSEELQVQMALGKAEARDVLERERKAFATFVQKERAELTKAVNKSLEGRRDFLTCVENLESSLYQEIPTTTKKYEEYKSNILQKIYELEDEVRKNYPGLSLNMQDDLDAFKVKMDAFRLNLALHDKTDPEKVERIRKEFTEKLVEVRQLLGAQENAKTKLDNFMEDIGESFNYLKRAISDLSN